MTKCKRCKTAIIGKVETARVEAGFCGGCGFLNISLFSNTHELSQYDAILGLEMIWPIKGIIFHTRPTGEVVEMRMAKRH